jgi:hypothetical protein
MPKPSPKAKAFSRAARESLEPRMGALEFCPGNPLRTSDRGACLHRRHLNETLEAQFLEYLKGPR